MPADPLVLPGIARHAPHFFAAGTGSTVLLYRHDSIVVINLTGLSKEEVTGVAKAAGNSLHGAFHTPGRARHEHPQRDSRRGRRPGRRCPRPAVRAVNDQASSAVGALLPALAGGLQRNVAEQGGLEALVGALTSGQHGRYLDDPALLGSADTISDGNAILGHILGTKDVSRAVASNAATTTGIGEDVLKKMLPVIATLAMGALSRQTATTGAARQRVGGLDDRQHRRPGQLPRHEQRRVDGRRRRGVCRQAVRRRYAARIKFF